MILSKDELLNKVKERMGEDLTDESLSFVEDVTDTVNHLEKNSGEDWEQKYNDLDSSWRKKYTERFFTDPEEIKNAQENNVKRDSERRTYATLFTEREG